MFVPRNFPVNNSKRENGTWECKICHKIFRQRKGFYQHINSNTHQPIKHSCSLCGKGFATLGALALLHNEQASHAHLDNGNDNRNNNSIVASESSDISKHPVPSQISSDPSLRSTFTGNAFSSNPLINNISTRPKKSHMSSHIANNNINEFAHDIQNNESYPNQYSVPTVLSSKSFQNSV